MPNKTDRQDAIKAILYSWIENEDPTAMGQLIRKGSFCDLYDEVMQLGELGRGKEWNKGVMQWMGCILQMYQIFREENFPGEEYDFMWSSNDEEFGAETRREFIRLLKHAVMQGSTYAFIANS